MKYDESEVVLERIEALQGEITEAFKELKNLIDYENTRI